MPAIRRLAKVLSLLAACGAAAAWAAVNPVLPAENDIAVVIPVSAQPAWPEQLAGLTPEQRQQMREQIREQWQNRPQEDRQRMREEFREQREFRRDERQRLHDDGREQPGNGSGFSGGGLRRGGGRF